MKIAELSKSLIIANISVKKWSISITCAHLLAQCTFLEVLKVEVTDFETFYSKYTFSAKGVISAQKLIF